MSLKALFSRVNQFQTKSGALNVAGKLRVYFDETDDLAPVYDEDGVVLAQPVILDNNGRAKGLMVQDDKTYRLEVYNASDALMFTVRHMVPGEGGGSGGGLETITSEDGSITVTHTEMGWDLSVTKPEPSVIQATSDELTAQGPFTIYEVRKVQGDDLWLDTTLKQIRCKRGWYHADFNVVFQNITARNEMLTIGFSDSLGQWHGEYHYDLSYTDQLCEACGFDFFVETDGTVFQIIETDTLPSGIKMFLTALDIHTLVAVVDGDGGGGIQEITSTDGSITVTASGTGVDLAVTNPAHDYTTLGSWDRSLQIDNTSHTISGDMQCVAIRQQINNSPSTFKYAKVCEADINTVTWINEWATTLQLSFQSSGAYYKGKSSGIFELNMENYVTQSGYQQKHEEDAKWILWDGDTHSPGLVKLYLYWRDDSSSQHYELWCETSNLKYYETIVAQAVMNCSMRNHLTSSLAIEQERNIWRFNSKGIESLKDSLPANLTLVGQWNPADASIVPVEDEGPGVYYVEYGVTTYAEALAAYQAGKCLVLRKTDTTIQQNQYDDLYVMSGWTENSSFVFARSTGYMQYNIILEPSASYTERTTVMATRDEVTATLAAEIAPNYYDLGQEYVTDDKFPIPVGTVVTLNDNTSSDQLQYVYRSKVEIYRNEWSLSDPLSEPSKWDKVHISDIMGQVFYVEIFQTPYDDIKAAYDRGDVLVGRMNGSADFYHLYWHSAAQDIFEFAAVRGFTWMVFTSWKNQFPSSNDWNPQPGIVSMAQQVNLTDLGEYNNQRTYSVGDLVYNNGNLYRCIVAIDVPENWTAAHWTQTSMNQELARFATVARTGDYNDLTNKPTIPAAQVQSDWNQTDTTAVDYIKNKPDVDDVVFVNYGTGTLTQIGTAVSAGKTVIAGRDTGSRIYYAVLTQYGYGVYYFTCIDENNVQTWSISPDGGDGTWAASSVSIPAAQIQSDWNQTDNTARDFIKNKPANLVQDANYVHTDNNFTNNDVTKLSGVETGAQVNVQANWNETDTTSDSYIQNKPTLATVATTGAYSDLSGTPTLATVATTGDYDDLSNKPTIPAAQVNSDWNASSGVAEILNKPTLATVATTGDYDDLTNKPTIPAAQVNSDWNASSGVAEILNKPSLATVATTGAYSDLSGTPNLATVATSGDYDDLTNKPTIPAAQVNSDWNASSGVAQILKKPTLATVATTGAYSDLSGTPTLATVATTGDYGDLSNTPTIPVIGTITL